MRPHRGPLVLQRWPPEAYIRRHRAFAFVPERIVARPCDIRGHYFPPVTVLPRGSSEMVCSESTYAGSDFDAFGPATNRVLGFDFTKDLAAGDTIRAVEWACTTVKGSDPLASIRLIGSPQVQGALTYQRVGNCVPGVTYALSAIVHTAQGDTQELWSNLSCEPVGC